MEKEICNVICIEKEQDRKAVIELTENQDSVTIKFSLGKLVLKKEGDSSDDILFYENSLISMAKDWENMYVDGEVEDKPIANSLKELINNMNVNPNIRKKEENKCCL